MKKFKRRRGTGYVLDGFVLKGWMTGLYGSGCVVVESNDADLGKDDADLGKKEGVWGC